MLTTARCLQNLRSIKDIVYNDAAIEFMNDLAGEQGPKREEIKFGEAIAVGPFREKNGQKTCFRAVINGSLVESGGYERNPNRNNYVVELAPGGIFASVSEFFVDQGRLQARVQRLQEDPMSISDMCPTIKKFVVDSKSTSLPVETIISGPLMAISKSGGLYLVDHRPSPEAT
jgi:hypothetical protein